MKPILALFALALLASSSLNSRKRYNDVDILRQLDLAFDGTPSGYYPSMPLNAIKYNFFLNLEDGYCEVAGSKIHLYADSTRWAIVFEKSGFQNRGSCATIDLDYVGNCINYPTQTFKENNYVSNASSIMLIEPGEFDRIENKAGAKMETFELIGKDVKTIRVRDQFIPFDNDYRNYEKVGIKIRPYDNPNKLVGFGDLIRYLNETNPQLISAKDQEIRQHIPKDLPKLMTLNKFHFVSAYDKSKPPSRQETYKLIAWILTSRDTTNWKPTEKPNNHWRNWESGNL